MYCSDCIFTKESIDQTSVARRIVLSHVNSNKRMVTILMKILSYIDWSIKWWCPFSYSWDTHWCLLCQWGVMPAIGNGHQTQGLSGIVVSEQWTSEAHQHGQHLWLDIQSLLTLLDHKNDCHSSWNLLEIQPRNQKNNLPLYLSHFISFCFNWSNTISVICLSEVHH